MNYDFDLYFLTSPVSEYTFVKITSCSENNLKDKFIENIWVLKIIYIFNFNNKINFILSDYEFVHLSLDIANSLDEIMKVCVRADGLKSLAFI